MMRRAYPLAGAAALLPIAAALAETPEARAARLNDALTTQERIGLVHGPMAIPWAGKPIPAGALGSAGYVPAIARLGIPALQMTDASLGVTNPLDARPGDGATALPSGAALASTFDPELAFAGGRLIGGEAHAKGFNVLLAGGANLVRDPRNGRNFEYLSEDPWLTGVMAGRAIAGIQSQAVVSTVKHFALNGQETGRMDANSIIDEAAFRESDLLAFELAIERGRPGAVMCAYNLVDGEKACGNHHLLTDVLKRDWHYPGWVMSDWGATRATGFANAGLDQQMGEQLDAQIWFGAPLARAVANGTVPAAWLRDMTGRILHSMVAVGLLDRPARPGGAIDPAAGVAVARQVATEGIVLLKNDGNQLPLAAGAKRIVVIGGHADMGTLSGGGSSQVVPPGGAKRVIPLGGAGLMAPFRNMTFQSRPIVDAIRERAGKAEVIFDDGRYPQAAAALARSADVVIVVGNQWMGEGEDAPDLSLPDGQDELIAAVAAANPHTVVLLQTGGAVLMPWLDRVPAVIEAWYSGAGGADAIADVLFGVVNPSGHLPVSFPASLDQYPRVALPGWGLPDKQQFDVPYGEGAIVGYKRFADTGAKPLFAFGHGLSYTSFRYDGLKVTGGRTLSIALDVTNAGKVAGKAVPQAYLLSAAGRPLRRLIGFEKVALAPGETRRVTFAADPRLLAHFDVGAHRWRVDAGSYRVAVGEASDALPLTGEARVGAATIAP